MKRWETTGCRAFILCLVKNPADACVCSYLRQSGANAGQMLELRIFNGELMTSAAFLSQAEQLEDAGWVFPAGLSARAKSAVSLGLMEDLGWYFPSYDNAQPLPWGHGKGLDFAVSPCNSWPDEQQ
eukprot:scaffold32578_cov38-Prasinocladus_malaysianus.AAC.1